MNTIGSTPVTITACDAFPLCASTTLNVVVTANHPPTSNGITNQLWYSTVANSYTVPAFTDIDGDAITYSLTGCPAGVAFNPATRVVSMAANGVAFGVYACTLTATDGFTGGTTNVPLTITVGAGPT